VNLRYVHVVSAKVARKLLLTMKLMVCELW
jgi:hypothetical protein